MRRPATFWPPRRRSSSTAYAAGSTRARALAAATILAASILLPATAGAATRAPAGAPHHGSARREPHRVGPTAHAAVIDGSTAAAGTWPWLAFVANLQASTACSGTVISPMVVLTAAHCVEDVATGSLTPASAFRVVTGAVDWSAATAHVTAVAAVEVDPAFDRATLDDDAAVLVLASPTGAPSLPLATPADTALSAQGTAVAIAGWGSTYSGETTPPTVLHWGASVLQGQTFCANEEYVDGVPFDAGNDLCALDAPSLAVASCHGDSGGPLLASDGSGNPVQIGITSRGDPLCNPDFPSVFTRADAISAWVQSVVAANQPPVVQAAVSPALPAALPVAAAVRPSPRARPAAGSYIAATSAARSRVSIDVASSSAARARVQLHFTLACPARRNHTATISVRAVTGAAGWHFSATGIARHRWRYSVSGSYRAPGTIAGTFTVTARDRRCSTGRVSWRATAAGGRAATLAQFRQLRALDIRSSIPNNPVAADIPLPRSESDHGGSR